MTNPTNDINGNTKKKNKRSSLYGSKNGPKYKNKTQYFKNKHTPESDQPSTDDTEKDKEKEKEIEKEVVVDEPEDSVPTHIPSPTTPSTPPPRVPDKDHKIREPVTSGRYKRDRHPRPDVEPNTSHESMTNNVTKASLDLDEKVTLFKYKSSRILEIINQNNSLLAHGVFEIFQLHHGDVTYLSCGSSFIYPLLSKIKIFRINLNQFLLPLTNPERYWKVFIDSEEANVIDNLVNAFERNVQYISLYDAAGSKSPVNMPNSNYNFIDFKPKELESPPRENIYLSNDIPDSPPSVPVSPIPVPPSKFQLTPHKEKVIPHQLSPTIPRILKKESIQSLNTNVACLDINSKLLLHQPKPKKTTTSYQPNPVNNPYLQQTSYSTIDEKSESSMDSLLDEYEENINKSVSMASRPQTRQPSIASTQYQRRLPPIYDEGVRNHNPIENRVHNYNTNGFSKSRRSSISDLYFSESGWMEPNPNPPPTNGNFNRKIPKSRSTYSIKSSTSDLHHIYRNIPLRNNNNLSSTTNTKIEEDSKSIRSMSRLPTAMSYRSDLNRRRQSAYVAPTSQTNNDVKLNSQEIYKMLSSKPDKPILRQPTTSKSTSFTSRLFGW